MDCGTRMLVAYCTSNLRPSKTLLNPHHKTYTSAYPVAALRVRRESTSPLSSSSVSKPLPEAPCSEVTPSGLFLLFPGPLGDGEPAELWLSSESVFHDSLAMAG